ncbi:hypothetical protein Tco_0039090 [Tanacetum coccineum]
MSLVDRLEVTRPYVTSHSSSIPPSTLMRAGCLLLKFLLLHWSNSISFSYLRVMMPLSNLITALAIVRNGVPKIKVLAKVGKVAYRLELPQELSRVHHTFHVSNLKKCYADEPLVVLLEGIHVDDKLRFIEEPVEIIEREIKRLKRSRISLVKVRWNSRRGPEFTWEHEDSFKQKYPQLFTNQASSSTTSIIVFKFKVSPDCFGWGVKVYHLPPALSVREDAYSTKACSEFPCPTKCRGVHYRFSHGVVKFSSLE